jgi:hypothetical protein
MTPPHSVLQQDFFPSCLSFYSTSLAEGRPGRNIYPIFVGDVLSISSSTQEQRWYRKRPAFLLDFNALRPVSITSSFWFGPSPSPFCVLSSCFLRHATTSILIAEKFTAGQCLEIHTILISLLLAFSTRQICSFASIFSYHWLSKEVKRSYLSSCGDT